MEQTRDRITAIQRQVNINLMLLNHQLIPRPKIPQLGMATLKSVSHTCTIVAQWRFISPTIYECILFQWSAGQLFPVLSTRMTEHNSKQPRTKDYYRIIGQQFAETILLVCDHELFPVTRRVSARDLEKMLFPLVHQLDRRHNGAIRFYTQLTGLESHREISRVKATGAWQRILQHPNWVTYRNLARRRWYRSYLIQRKITTL